MANQPYNSLEYSSGLYGGMDSSPMDPKNYNFNMGESNPWYQGPHNFSLTQPTSAGGDPTGGGWGGFAGAIPGVLKSWQPYMGLAGTGAGIISAIMGARQQSAYNKQLERLTRQPIDLNQFYSPLSQQAEAAIRRGVTGDLASRGVQPGGYWDNQIAEVMANQETQRRGLAAQLAAAQRQQQIAALQGRTVPTPMVGGIDALGKALALYDTQQARQEAQRAQLARTQQEKDMLERIMEMVRTGRSNTPQYNIPISNTATGELEGI